MPVAPLDSWTVELLHQLPDDGQRYEIVEGQLHVSPAPSYLHQRAILELVLLLKPYCDQVGLELLFAPAAVTWSRRTEVQPDILTMPLADGRRPERFEDVGRLELAVEVLSPSTLRWDRFTKRHEYQRRGVPMYWIVDLASRSVECWRPGDDEPEIRFDSVEWAPVADHAPIAIDLAVYFARVHDERAPRRPAKG